MRRVPDLQIEIEFQFLVLAGGVVKGVDGAVHRSVLVVGRPVTFRFAEQFAGIAFLPVADLLLAVGGNLASDFQDAEKAWPARPRRDRWDGSRASGSGRRRTASSTRVSRAGGATLAAGGARAGGLLRCGRDGRATEEDRGA